MRLSALVLLAACSVPIFAEDGAPTAPAPATLVAPTPAPADAKAAMKELENKLKAIREVATKGDPELTKLKVESDDARKRLDTAVDLKLKDNADYQASKTQYDELKAKRNKKADVPAAPAAPPVDAPKGEQPKL